MSAEEAGTTAASPTDVSISKPAEMMMKLQELAKSNPERFKEVTGAIASKLEASAAEQPGTAGEKLKEMAAQFAEALRSGDARGLTPAQEPEPLATGSSARGALQAYAQNGPAAGAHDPAKQALNFAFSLADELAGKTTRAD